MFSEEEKTEADEDLDQDSHLEAIILRDTAGTSRLANEFQLLGIIGEGGFGQVLKVCARLLLWELLVDGIIKVLYLSNRVLLLKHPSGHWTVSSDQSSITYTVLDYYHLIRDLCMNNNYSVAHCVYSVGIKVKL